MAQRTNKHWILTTTLTAQLFVENPPRFDPVSQVLWKHKIYCLILLPAAHIGIFMRLHSLKC